jgi:citrate/tricarballylate utilization protein
MTPLDALVREARSLAGGVTPGTRASRAAPEDEAARLLQICNACRYCEGFCAVFPAMARRLEFPAADIHYLANLCHNCGACLHACQYASPHEFDVNVPRAMARVRGRTYAHYAWPARFSRLYERNGLVIALALALGLALFLVLGLVLKGTLWGAAGQGNFYAVFPHALMVWMFGPVFALALLALGLGVRRFWRDITPGLAGTAAIADAAGKALTLKYLDGGHGEGCNEADDAFTPMRRVFHHLTFYGFALCFVATCIATLYHYALGLQAPYAFTSLPVLLGTAGGIGLLIGPAGLWWLNARRHADHGDAAQRPMDRAFIALLFLTSLTGLALLIWRDSAAMALLLAVHLGVVMALFATLPYGKFAHGVYRCAALLKWAIERRQPLRIRLGSE